MSLGEVFVLADEDDDRVPEVLRLVLPQSISNYFGLADVCQIRTGFCVNTEQKVHTRTLKLIASEKVFQLSSWRRKCLPGPIGDFANTQALCIPLRQKEFDRR